MCVNLELKEVCKSYIVSSSFLLQRTGYFCFFQIHKFCHVASTLLIIRLGWMGGFGILA